MPRAMKCQLSEAPFPQLPSWPSEPTPEAVSLEFSPKEHNACLP